MEQAQPDSLFSFVVFLYTLGLSGNLVWSSDEHLKQLSQAKAKAEANNKQKQKDLWTARAATHQADKACILKLSPMNLHQFCCRKTLSSSRPDVAAYFRRRSQTSGQRDHQKCGVRIMFLQFEKIQAISRNRLDRGMGGRRMRTPARWKHLAPTDATHHPTYA